MCLFKGILTDWSVSLSVFEGKPWQTNTQTTQRHLKALHEIKNPQLEGMRALQVRIYER